MTSSRLHPNPLRHFVPLLVAFLGSFSPQFAHALSRVKLMTPIGAAANDSLGCSVASAGDLNGDGFADVIVGADHNDAGGTDAGRAYVYYGGVGPDSIADLVLTGESAGDLFGHSVACAGDVNGDGYSDVIVGAPHNGAGGANAGRAYVFYGGPGADNVPDLVLTGVAAGDFFGNSVASAGDVNGDGYADVIIGAFANDAGGTDAGRAYVFFGGPGADSTPDLVLTGAAAGDNFGFSVASAGDVNRDGYADVIVGAPLNDASGTNAGRAYLYFGGPSADAVPDLTMNGIPSDEFGYSVAGAGDVNGDGYGDVIVGAPYDGFAGTAAGRAFVFYGGSSPDPVPDLFLTGSHGFDYFGISVGAGDVNGDGYSDLIVGALIAGSTGPKIGKAYVYYGGTGIDTVADLTTEAESKSDNFGGSVATAGDVNGDGFADIVVGAAGNDAGVPNAGRAYVFVYERGILAARTLLSPIGATAGDEFGWCVANAGDVNGDGYPDMIVGAPHALSQRGRAYIFFGGPGADAVPDLVLTGENDFDNFGTSVAGAGDVNGDGYADVIVGAQGYPPGGRAYVFYGGPIPNSVPDLTLPGGASGELFGFSVAGAGDVNGDGYADVIVGMPGASSGVGRAFIFYGGPGADAVADLFMTGVGAEDFGYSVASAGDVNGDGYSDWIVGAPFSSAGRAYVFYGGASPNTTADLTLNGAAAGASLGYSVSGAGDVNGDGYADVIVGAPATGLLGTHHAYVYYGGPGADATADLTLSGAPSSRDNFGRAVGSAGDMNGDGFSDVLVATALGSGSSDNAYVFLGGAVPDPFPDFSLNTSGVSSSDFGQSVASAGDQNGRGLDDVLVGAPINDTSNLSAGQFFLIRLDRAAFVSSPLFVPTEEFGTATFPVRAADPDGDAILALTVNKSMLPGGNDATFTTSGDHKTGTFTWHPQSGMAGSFSPIFTATSGLGLQRADTTRIQVASVGTSILGTFTWTPTAADTGGYDVTFQAVGTGGSSSATTHVTVTAASPSARPVVRPVSRIRLAAQRGPIISSPLSASVSAGNTLSFSASATDADTLTSNTTALPIDNTATFALDRRPVLTAPAGWSADPSTPVSFTVTAADSDGDAITGLTADLSYLPVGNNAVFTPNGNNTSGLFTWTPAASDSGVFVVIFHSANALADVASTTLTVKTGLRGYWRLDGTGTDGAGPEDLAAVGGVTYAAGKIGTAADISGAGAGRLTRAALGAGYDFTGGGFTFECWVNVRSLAFGIDPRIAFAGSTGASYWEIHVCDEGCTTGTARLRLVTPSTTTELQTNANINNAAWHHLAATYDGSKLRLYVDGVLDDSLAQPGISIATSGGTFSLGARPAGENQFDGLIDEVRVWARARTQAEIQATMNQALSIPTGVQDGAPPVRNALLPNRPNPFNPSTRIEFDLAHAGRARLRVFDVSGRRVATLLDRDLAAGRHSAFWSGRDDEGRPVASGVYLYRVEAPGFTQTRKMALLK
jgi:hypothetical protein